MKAAMQLATALAAMLAPQSGDGAPEVFVAPQNCSDSAAGTERQPLCSISVAVAQLRGGGGASGRTVVLRAGTFTLRSASYV